MTQDNRSAELRALETWLETHYATKGTKDLWTVVLAWMKRIESHLEAQQPATEPVTIARCALCNGWTDAHVGDCDGVDRACPFCKRLRSKGHARWCNKPEEAEHVYKQPPASPETEREHRWLYPGARQNFLSDTLSVRCQDCPEVRTYMLLPKFSTAQKGD